MKLFCAFAAVAAMTFILATASLAGPQDYCDSFAQQAANRKTGHGELTTGTIGGDPADSIQKATGPDENWRSAYEASFAACVANYEAPQETASNSEPAPKKASKSRSSRSKASRHRHVRSAAVKKAKAKAPRKAPPVQRRIQTPSIQSTAAPVLTTNVEQLSSRKVKVVRKSPQYPRVSVRRTLPAKVKSNVAQPRSAQEPQTSNTSQQCRNLTCLMQK